ncbi:MAG: hypothetical protein BWX67_01638 [Thermotogae bacterium ADurb.Bin062]|nr:MAG: hypothetical protein BWX67_01638 [Thermotogota bacterium ADurb.Bin062]
MPVWGYRAVAKRRSAYATMPVWGIAPSREEGALTPRCPCGGIAPSREKGALTPRCPRSLCPLCEPCVIETGRVEVGPTKRRGAYVAMTTRIRNCAIVSGFVS